MFTVVLLFLYNIKFGKKKLYFNFDIFNVLIVVKLEGGGPRNCIKPLLLILDGYSEINVYVCSEISI